MTAREVIVGVTGGIAAYKAAAVVSKLAQSDIAVSVVMTESAMSFVGSATFSALSGRPTYSALFEAACPLGAHIELARRADLLCVAPASANFLARAAQGIADDLLSTLYLCFTGPVIMAPAMNQEMWAKPAVQRNVEQLVADGVSMVGPAEGWLSCRVRGQGRMAEPETILDAVRKQLAAI
jgi:phosphopantothenoylcysteine decarboxylase/phosphopantothenate--cysteine ligase